MTAGRTEDVYILYGSQSGSTEKEAVAFSEEMMTELSSDSIEKLVDASSSSSSKENASVCVKPTVMKLDDFLELHRGKWPRLVVIFVSSYGAGEAPTGAKKFRQMCDALVQRYEHNHKIQSSTLPLRGIHYALCGFGQFSFKTVRIHFVVLCVVLFCIFY